MMSSWSMGSVLRTTKRTRPLGTRTRVRENRLWWMVSTISGTRSGPDRDTAVPGPTDTPSASAAAARCRSGGRLTFSPPEQAPGTKANQAGRRRARGQRHRHEGQGRGHRAMVGGRLERRGGDVGGRWRRRGGRGRGGGDADRGPRRGNSRRGGRVQSRRGEVCAQRLTRSLDAHEGEPHAGGDA